MDIGDKLLLIAIQGERNIDKIDKVVFRASGTMCSMDLEPAGIKESLKIFEN